MDSRSSEDTLVFIEDDVGWDDPRGGPPRARTVERRSRPRVPERSARARRRRQPQRTLAADLARLRDATARRPLVALAVGIVLLAGVALIVAIARSAGGDPSTARLSHALRKPQTAATASAAGATLRPGARGAAVRRLQAALSGVGLYDGAADGIYGDGTTAAVASFQRSHDLAVTGTADAATNRALEQALAERAAPEAATARDGLARAVSSGRLSSAAAERDRRILSRAAATIGRAPGTRGATLAAVLHDVAVQAPIYDEPRSLALFGMLDANARYLAQHDPTSERQDIEDGAGIVYRFYTGHGFQFQPLANFARLNGHVSTDDPEGARKLAKALVARGVRDGDQLLWEYYFPFRGPSHWTSGLAQSVAAQSLARTADAVHDHTLATAAHRAFRSLPETLSRPLGGGLWIREYGFSDIAILNAQLQSLVSLTDYAKRTPEAGDVQRFVRLLDVASRTLLPALDTGCWSRYSLGGADATLHYHEYHVQLLRRLAHERGDAVWRTYADRWGRFLRNRSLPCSSR